MDKNIYEMIEYPKEGILSKIIIENNELDLTLFCMAKNSKMSEHTSTRQGIIQVLEGNGIFNLNGKEIKMIKGKIIHMKENSPHSLKALENTSFLLTLI